MMRVFHRMGFKGNDPFCGIAIGDKVKDSLTGFTGVVIGRSEHITGCNQCYVLPGSEKDNEIKDGHWLDIERIEKIEDQAVWITARRTGADIPPPRITGKAL